jgi:AraC family L-rhamnose operon regulatory protein RhaS
MKPAAFVAGGHAYHADTCAELVRAVERGDLRLEAMARGTYPGERLAPRAVPGVRSVGYWDARHDQNWGLPVHRNEGIEFTYMASGSTGIAVNGRSSTLRPGDLLVTRPWQPHRVGGPLVGAGRLYWLILDVGVRRPHQPWRWPSWLVLDPPDLVELTRLLRRSERPVWRAAGAGARFEALGRVVEGVGRVESIASRLVLEINGLLFAILEALRAQPVAGDPELTSAERATEMFLAELEQSFAEPWTLDTMAESAGLHRTRFAHYVRKLRNLTPLEHLASVRVDRARRLIRERPGRSLTEIGMECGFASSQYFATVFRRVTGHSPREERLVVSAAAGSRIL